MRKNPSWFKSDHNKGDDLETALANFTKNVTNGEYTAAYEFTKELAHDIKQGFPDVAEAKSVYIALMTRAEKGIPVSLIPDWRTYMRVIKKMNMH